MSAIRAAIERLPETIERTVRAGTMHEYECNGTTCAWCEQGFPWQQDGERYFHRVRDEVVVTYVREDLAAEGWPRRGTS